MITGGWVGKNGVTVTRRCQPHREGSEVEVEGKRDRAREVGG